MNKPGDGGSGLVKQDPDGTVWGLWIRQCSDGSSINVWVTNKSPKELADAARNEVSKLLPLPSAEMSPAPDVGGYVNFETWLAVRDPGPVQATAALPWLSSTVTARIVSVDWAMGDGSVVHCAGTGTPRPGASTAKAPCGHTYQESSAGQPGLAFAVRVTQRWQVSWTASTGEGGALADLVTTSTVPYQVREVQTVGEGS